MRCRYLTCQRLRTAGQQKVPVPGRWSRLTRGQLRNRVIAVMLLQFETRRPNRRFSRSARDRYVSRSRPKPHQAISYITMVSGALTISIYEQGRVACALHSGEANSH
jgi:hypothetical protein